MTMRVFYVEDDAHDIELVKQALIADDPTTEIAVAHTVDTAREQLLKEGNSYDVIIVDISLPDGSGLDLISELRQSSISSPIIVLTGYGDEAAALTALRIGADDFHVKSSDFVQLLPATLSETVKRYRQESYRLQHPLRVLYAEHQATDIDQTQRYFSAKAPELRLEIVRSSEEVQQRLPEDASQPADFDVLLLDYHLEGDGPIELLRMIRYERGLDIPIVLISEQGDASIIAAAMRFGASDYVLKHPGYLYQLPFALFNAYYRVQLAREQAALRESEARFRRLTENVPDIIYRFDFYPTPHLSYVSHAVSEVLGYSPSECLASPARFPEFAHPDDRPQLLAAMKSEPAVAQFNPIRWLHKNGRTVWIEQRASPVYDEDGKLIAIEGVARDITEQKQAEALLHAYYMRLEEMVEERTRELQEAQTELLKQERLAILGQLAASVGHELRNPLSVMANAVYYLRLIQPDRNAQVSEYLDILAGEIKKSSHIIQSLLEFARTKQVHLEPNAIDRMINVVLTGLDQPDNIEVITDIPEDLAPVYVDAQHMDQVFTNLILNAYQAMPEGGTLTIDASFCEEGVGETSESVPAIKVRIRDTGEGIAPEHLERIFEPLFTTKTRGVGLGLALVKSLIEANHGRIEVESKLGKGATFTVWLPTATV